MRRCSALLFVALLPTAALAQRGRGGPPGPGGRGPLVMAMSDGEPISFFLERARELDVTDTQRAALIDIRRRLRSVNAPFMQALDSLRGVVGLAMGERRRLDEGDREALERFRAIASEPMDAIRLNNEGAMREVRAVLEPRQLTLADSLARSDGPMRGRGREGRGGRRGPPGAGA